MNTLKNARCEKYRVLKNKVTRVFNSLNNWFEENACPRALAIYDTLEDDVATKNLMLMKDMIECAMKGKLGLDYDEYVANFYKSSDYDSM